MEYPKWIYPAGIKEAYEPGEEPFIVQNAEEEAAFASQEDDEPQAGDAEAVAGAEAPKRRGRPARVAGAE